MGALLRWREPVVVVLLVLVAVRALLVLGLGVAALAGAQGPYGLATWAAARAVAEPLSLVLLAALVAACHAAPPTASAHPLTVLALVVLVLAVLAGLAATVAVLTQPDLGGLPGPLRLEDAAERLLALVVPVLAALAAAALLRRPAAPAEAAEVPLELATGPGSQLEAAADPQLEPTWQPGAATGAVWLSAGDAASGRPPAPAPAAGDSDEPHPWATGPR